MRLLITLPTWKIALLMWIWPIIGMMTIGSVIEVEALDNTEQGTQYRSETLQWLALWSLGTLWVQLFWIKACGDLLAGRLNSENLPSLKLFSWTINFSLVYQSLHTLVLLPNLLANGGEPVAQAWYLTLLQAFAMFATIYPFYFVAFCLCLSESSDEKPKLLNMIGNILLLWILPVGVLFLQSRIKKIIESQPKDFYIEM